MSKVKIVRMPEVLNAFGYKSHVSVYDLIRSGQMTKPIPIGLRSVGWPNDEVDAIVEARIAEWDEEKTRALVDRLHARRVERAAQLEAA